MQHNDEKADFTLIATNLYLGSGYDVRRKAKLEQYNITHICQVQKGIIPAFPKDYKYLVIPVVDITVGQNLLQYFDQTFDFIEEGRSNGNTVIVHCGAGISRSATVVIAYVMKKKKIPFVDAYNIVKKRRRIIEPNTAFVQQLKQYESIVLQ